MRPGHGAIMGYLDRVEAEREFVRANRTQSEIHPGARLVRVVLQAFRGADDRGEGAAKLALQHRTLSLATRTLYMRF